MQLQQKPMVGAAEAPDRLAAITIGTLSIESLERPRNTETESIVCYGKESNEQGNDCCTAPPVQRRDRNVFVRHTELEMVVFSAAEPSEEEDTISPRSSLCSIEEETSISGTLSSRGSVGRAQTKATTTNIRDQIALTRYQNHGQDWESADEEIAEACSFGWQPLVIVLAFVVVLSDELRHIDLGGSVVKEIFWTENTVEGISMVALSLVWIFSWENSQSTQLDETRDCTEEPSEEDTRNEDDTKNCITAPPLQHQDPKPALTWADDGEIATLSDQEEEEEEDREEKEQRTCSGSSRSCSEQSHTEREVFHKEERRSDDGGSGVPAQKAGNLLQRSRLIGVIAVPPVMVAFAYSDVRLDNMEPEHIAEAVALLALSSVWIFLGGADTSQTAATIGSGGEQTGSHVFAAEREINTGDDCKENGQEHYVADDGGYSLREDDNEDREDYLLEPRTGELQGSDPGTKVDDQESFKGSSRWLLLIVSMTISLFVLAWLGANWDELCLAPEDIAEGLALLVLSFVWIYFRDTHQPMHHNEEAGIGLVQSAEENKNCDLLVQSHEGGELSGECETSCPDTCSGHIDKQSDHVCTAQGNSCLVGLLATPKHNSSVATSVWDMDVNEGVREDDEAHSADSGGRIITKGSQETESRPHLFPLLAPLFVFGLSGLDGWVDGSSLEKIQPEHIAECIALLALTLVWIWSREETRPLHQDEKESNGQAPGEASETKNCDVLFQTCGPSETVDTLEDPAREDQSLGDFLPTQKQEYDNQAEECVATESTCSSTVETLQHQSLSKSGDAEASVIESTFDATNLCERDLNVPLLPMAENEVVPFEQSSAKEEPSHEDDAVPDEQWAAEIRRQDVAAISGPTNLDAKCATDHIQKLTSRDEESLDRTCGTQNSDTGKAGIARNTQTDDELSLQELQQLSLDVVYECRGAVDELERADSGFRRQVDDEEALNENFAARIKFSHSMGSVAEAPAQDEGSGDEENSQSNDLIAKERLKKGEELVTHKGPQEGGEEHGDGHGTEFESDGNDKASSKDTKQLDTAISSALHVVDESHSAASLSVPASDPAALQSVTLGTDGVASNQHWPLYEETANHDEQVQDREEGSIGSEDQAHDHGSEGSDGSHTEDDNDSNLSFRSIFNTYWTAQPQSGSTPRRSSLPGAIDEVRYEQRQPESRMTLEKEHLQQPMGAQRRSFFTKECYSQPAALKPGSGDANLAPTLKSSLRPCRYSGDSLHQHFHDQNPPPIRRSVTFSTENEVSVFETPVEQWAADGWLHWFS